MIDVLRIAHLRIAPQEGNLEVGNCEGIFSSVQICSRYISTQIPFSGCIMHCNAIIWIERSPNHSQLLQERLDALNLSKL